MERVAKGQARYRIVLTADNDLAGGAAAAGSEGSA
jgi:hypothetical protein